MIETAVLWLVVGASVFMSIVDLVLIRSYRKQIAAQHALIVSQRRLLAAQRETIAWNEATAKIMAGRT